MGSRNLVEELAEAGRWEEIESLTDGLLPRQRSVALVKVGSVAAKQGDTNRLAWLRSLVTEIADSCATIAGLNRQGLSPQDLYPRQGTPADRFVCRSNQARLDGLMARVTELPQASQQFDLAFSLACSLVVNGAVTRPQFHALTTIVQTIALRPDLKSASRHPARRYVARIIRCWRGMLHNEHDSLSVVAHDLITLMELAATVRKTAPTAWPTAGRCLRHWNAKLLKIADWLPTSERDALWLHVVRNAVEADVLARGRAIAAIKRISNGDKRSPCNGGRCCTDVP